MMKKVMLTLAIAATFAGCSKVDDTCFENNLLKQNHNHLNIESAPIGSTIDEVIAHMGQAPVKRTKYEMNDGRVLEVVEFTALHNKCYPYEANFAPAVFENNVLIGSGGHYFHALIGPEIKGVYTPPKPQPEVKTKIEVMPQPSNTNTLQMMPMVMTPRNGGHPILMMVPVVPARPQQKAIVQPKKKFDLRNLEIIPPDLTSIAD